jgi:hypothetical protein
MDAKVMFLDCPAYVDELGAVRCGLPAEVQDRYTMTSTGGPVECAKIRCPRRHWFSGPVEFFTWAKDVNWGTQGRRVTRTGSRHPHSPTQ